ncbi:patatin-like phospholipase family protein [Sneathiella sp.]|uniref:patatin-like phospholipase family protein n=1 Tax=Sneathiella sp. TaxID=1964365 RepID=UPI003566EE08
MKNKITKRCGIVLTGGGARGAYQVGVLRALSELSDTKKVAFPVITGVSVGAINAAALAANFDDFNYSVQVIENFWKKLHTKNVFDANLMRVILNASRMFLSEFVPFMKAESPKSLFQNYPLRQSLEKGIDFSKIKQAVSTDNLFSVGVTCSGYSTGNAKTFFETASNTTEWHRERREGMICDLAIDHVMASSALPVLFPAVKIGSEYFGDGSLRLTSPLAPAIHLGGTKLLIVGTRDKIQATRVANEMTPTKYPSIGDIAGYTLDTVFHDSLDADIERLQRINTTIGLIPASEIEKTSLKHITTLVINPSRDLKKIALNYRGEMPRSLRWIVAREGKSEAVGLLESYLLFEPGYIGTLIDLGYKDTMARGEDILEFFRE